MNSNPATIMTDPEFADATYIEPLLPGPVAQVIERERPDALLATLGGQTALNLAKALHDDGTLERFERRADRRQLRGDRVRRGPRAVRRGDGARRAADAAERDRDDGRAGDARRSGSWACRASCAPRSRSAAAAAGSRATEEELRRARRARDRGLADRPGAARPVGDRLGRVRARGDARRRRQRRDRLLDREHRPDGRAHGRLGHGRAAADAHRRPLPAAARPGDRGDPRGRRGDGRLERAVRGQPGDRGDPRDRDEPARVALLGAGVEGDGLSDREDRRAARGRLPAGRDRQRHHRRDPGVLRADDRLRRRQVAALRVREVSRRRPDADDAHEVGRRGDGDRPHVLPGVRQGAALARAGQAAVPR